MARIRAAGGIALAKTNLPEFSYWTETDNLLVGKTRNLWDGERTPGGVERRRVGRDRRGYVAARSGQRYRYFVAGACSRHGHRRPEGDQGRIPITGHWPEVPGRYWHVSPMARSVRDVVTAFTILAGPDGVDGNVRHSPLVGEPADLTGLRVGWVAGAAFGPVDPEVTATAMAAADALKALGCAVSPAPLDGLKTFDGIALSAMLFGAEIVPYFRRAVAGRESEEHPVTQRTTTSPEVTLADYIDAQRQVDAMKSMFAGYFERARPFPSTSRACPRYRCPSGPAAGTC